MQRPDFSAFADTDLGLELSIEAEFWASTSVAGLQFYSYAMLDRDLDIDVMPRAGDRLTLMRRPDNQADYNAVEVWWKNHYMLGHLPRGVAA